MSQHLFFNLVLFHPMAVVLNPHTVKRQKESKDRAELIWFCMAARFTCRLYFLHRCGNQKHMMKNVTEVVTANAYLTSPNDKQVICWLHFTWSCEPFHPKIIACLSKKASPTFLRDMLVFTNETTLLNQHH